MFGVHCLVVITAELLVASTPNLYKVYPTIADFNAPIGIPVI